MIKPLLPIFALCLSLVPSGFMFAQITVELDSITVSASRISSDISASGKSISVISAETIQATGALSVDELLRSLPGVNINARQGFGVQADVGIRGSTYSQVLFMLDHIPLNDPLTGHFNTNIPVSLSEIGQIELIRGPAAASFGSDAVGGVIHIKTNSYLQRERDTRDLESRSRVNLDLSGGEYGLRIGDLSVWRSTGSLDFSAAVRYAASDGESFPNPAFGQGFSDEEEFQTYFELFNLTAATVWRPSSHTSLYLRAGLDERDFNARYFYTLSPFDQSTEEIRSRWILSAFTRDDGIHRTEVHSSFRRTKDRFDFNPTIVAANEHETDLTFLNGSHQVTFYPGNRLRKMRWMGGAQFTGKKITSTDRGNHSTTSAGLYSIAAFSFGSGMDLHSALRFQADPGGHTTWLPQLSAALNQGRLTLRGSAGRATRTADFTELYISSAIERLTPLRNRGYPSLAPELSWSLDAGADWRSGEYFSFSGTLYYRTSSNLIDYVLTRSDEIPFAENLIPGEFYFLASNISRATTHGFESSVRSVIPFSSSRSLQLDAGFTRIITRSDSDSFSRYIANHPSSQLSGAIRFRAGRFSFLSESELQYRERESDEMMNAFIPRSIFLTHLRMEREIIQSGVSLNLTIRNVTDTSWQEILGAPMPGRWILLGVQYRR